MGLNYIYDRKYKIKCMCMLYILLNNNNIQSLNKVDSVILIVTYGQCLLNQCMELVMHWTFKPCQCGPWYSFSFRVCLHEMFLKHTQLFSFRANLAEEWKVTDHSLKWSSRILGPTVVHFQPSVNIILHYLVHCSVQNVVFHSGYPGSEISCCAFVNHINILTEYLHSHF